MGDSARIAGDRFAGRGLGIDLGTVRIGVALCDSNGTLATPYQTVQRSGDPLIDHQRLRALVVECDATFVVFGVPYSLASGEIGPAAQSMVDEIEQIRQSFGEHVDVHLQDERLTSVTAEQRLTEMGIKGKRRKQLVDQIAAAVILQTWLDGVTSGGSHHAPSPGTG